MEFPRDGLWISIIKMCEKLVVGQVPESGSLISHGVELTGEVVMEGNVAVVPLVMRL